MERIPVEIKATYRGFKVNFSEFSNEWSVEIDDESNAYENTDIKKVKQYIDKFIKSEFKPVKILFSSYGDDLKEVTLSSLDSENPKHVWIINDEGRRSKELAENCYVLNEHNLTTKKQIEEIDTKLESLREERGKLYKSLKQIDKKGF